MIIRDISKLHPLLRTKLVRALGYAHQHYNMEVYPFETRRSRERQKYLLGKGASRASVSLHQLDLAVDIYPVNERGYFIGGEELNRWPRWKDLGRIMKAYDFDWGGDWSSFQDKVHFQMTFGMETSNLIRTFERYGRVYFWKYIIDVEKTKKESQSFFSGGPSV